MAAIYSAEPATCGKVMVDSSHGDIEIELWSKQAPTACRNFVQHCLDGYYDNCTFHRVIKDFMVQTGDPTGTGSGGESAFGRPFQNELHSRLTFSHRGIVAMATPGSSDTNGSQFFITLDRCDWLNGKHTIFGKVVGTTIFNVVRMQEIETDESDRPIEPPVIYSTRVFWNPFDDIKPRPKQHSVEQSVPKESAEERRKRKKARKDYSLLSFGEEAEEEEGQNTSMPKIAAAHERLSSKDSKLSATPAVKPSQLQQEGEHKDVYEREEQQTGTTEDDPEDSIRGDFDEEMRKRVLAQHQQKQQQQRSPSTSAPEQGGKESADDKRKRQAEKKAQRLKRMGVSKAENAIPEHERALMTESEAKRKESKAKRSRTAKRESEMLDKLKAFEQSLSESTNAQVPKSGAEEKREGGIGITKHVPEGLYYAHEADGDESWMVHSLTTKAEKREDDPMEAPVSADDYIVLDPRNGE